MALANRSPKKLAEAGVEIPILDPVTDLPTGVFITVYGSDSETFRAIQRKQFNHRLERQAQKKGRAVQTAEALEAEAMVLLVGSTKSWRSAEKNEDDVLVSRPEIELEEGQWLPCTPDNVQKLYEQLPWVKEQVDAAIGDRSRFLPA